MRWYHWAGLYVGAGIVLATLNRLALGDLEDDSSAPLGTAWQAHAFQGYSTQRGIENVGHIGEVWAFAECALTWPVAIAYGLAQPYNYQSTE